LANTKFSERFVAVPIQDAVCIVFVLSVSGDVDSQHDISLR
jgi:hypothetical protein